MKKQCIIIFITVFLLSCEGLRTIDLYHELSIIPETMLKLNAKGTNGDNDFLIRTADPNKSLEENVYAFVMQDQNEFIDQMISEFPERKSEWEKLRLTEPDPEWDTKFFIDRHFPGKDGYRRISYGQFPTFLYGDNGSCKIFVMDRYLEIYDNFHLTDIIVLTQRDSQFVAYRKSVQGKKVGLIYNMDKERVKEMFNVLFQ